MSKDHWDAILASSPLNATAGRVTSKGAGFEPAIDFLERSWDAPPPLLKIAAEVLALPHFSDLTGLKVGRLVVLGMTEEAHGLWVCRCACGRYVGRKAASLKTGRSTKCNACNYTEQLRWQASGNRARERAEAPEARKWKTDDEAAA